MRRFATGVLAAVVLTTMVAAEQQRTSSTQRPPQKDQAGAPVGRGTPGGPPGGMQRAKWWQDERIKTDLRLAPEQSARIEEIFQAALTRMKPVADDLGKREEQLSNLIYGNDVTEAEVLRQAEQVEALRATLGQSRTLMLFRMRRVLSAEQRAKLADIQAQDRERRQGRQPDRGPGER